MMPVRPSKIIGIGRNYLEHARELGNEIPVVPILFFKPPTALIGSGDTILLPSVSTRVEFEAEIGVVIGKWAASDFGTLREERLAILAFTVIAVGAQIFFTSFLVSIIGLRRPRDEP